MTVLMEVEAVLNSRPLTYVYAEDVEEPLIMPSHLLIGRRLLTLPDTEQRGEGQSSTQETITKRARYQRTLADHFWTRWHKEYLLSLWKQHHLEAGKQQLASTIKVGDLVIVHEDNVQRNFWRLGRVERSITGSDGVVRGAAVKVGDRNKPSTVIEWPVQKLYPLETNEPTPCNQEELSIAHHLPSRRAAARAGQNI